MNAPRIDSLFDKRLLELGPPHLALVAADARRCEWCKRRLRRTLRADARTCSRRCRQAAWREAKRDHEPSPNRAVERRLLSSAARARTGLDSGSVPELVPLDSSSKRVLAVGFIRGGEVRIT